jgi:predicted dehydrogenase
VKIGIAGLGFMGSTHLNAYSKISGVEIAAVSSNSERALSGDLTQTGGNLNRAQSVHDFSAVRKHRDWRELTRDPQLDAVDICLPTDLHAPVALAALEADKHVLCEKPMALSADDCDRMIAVAAKRNRILMIGQILRFWPEYRYLKHFVTSGERGCVLSATFIRRCGIPDWSPWLADESRSGGAVIDLLIHDIDQALLLFGVPDRVAAKSIGGPDALMATLLYPSGPEVRIQGGWFEPTTPLSMSFQVRAERAELEWTKAGLMLSDDTGQRQIVEAEPGDAYDAEIAYFVECCRNGRQPARCLPQESARAVKLALLLKQSRTAGGQLVKCSV